MTDERYLVVQAVLARQISAAHLTDAELQSVTSDLYDKVIEEHLMQLTHDARLSIFWGESQPSVN